MSAPRWISKDAEKAKRQKAAKAHHDAMVARHAETRAERDAFRMEQEAAQRRRQVKPSRMTIATAEVERPAFTDEELRSVLGKASDEPAYLPYPEVMVLRERGLTCPVRGDDPRHIVPIYKGDVLTAEGRAWLMAT